MCADALTDTAFEGEPTDRNVKRTAAVTQEIRARGLLLASGPSLAPHACTLRTVADTSQPCAGDMGTCWQITSAL